MNQFGRFEVIYFRRPAAGLRLCLHGRGPPNRNLPEVPSNLTFRGRFRRKCEFPGGETRADSLFENEKRI